MHTPLLSIYRYYITLQSIIKTRQALHIRSDNFHWQASRVDCARHDTSVPKEQLQLERVVPAEHLRGYAVRELGILQELVVQPAEIVSILYAGCRRASRPNNVGRYRIWTWHLDVGGPPGQIIRASQTVVTSRCRFDNFHFG